MPAAQNLNALARLKKAANLVPIKRIVTLTDGSEFEFWATPLTMAERERAQKSANSDDASQFALQLLVQKALDENGKRLFSAGMVSELKNDVADADLQGLMLALLTSPDEIDEEAAKN
jgi:hypothetical protein